MALPINIHELIHGSTVEWERIEFKEGTKSGLGWDQVVSMCIKVKTSGTQLGSITTGFQREEY
jgi:hypothetical protein